MRILVTRPEPDASGTAARLVAAGHQAHVDPMLIVEPLSGTRLPDGAFNALALTSVNGARALAARAELADLLGLPLYAVGRRTAAAAPQGFSNVLVADGDGEALVALLRESLPRGSRILHVCGEDRAVDLDAALARNGLTVELFELYRARPAEQFSPATVTALRGRQIDAAFHFSLRTATTVVERARQAGVEAELASIVHFCFSKSVAAPLITAGWRTQIAQTPTEEGLFALLSR